MGSLSFFGPAQRGQSGNLVMTTEADLVTRADRLAARAHAEQRRKYTDDPYIVHPRAVAAIVATVPHTQDMLAAALLHDVLEDTSLTLAELEAQVGSAVAGLVLELTDQIGLDRGNRATRKRLEAERLATVSAEAQTIKLADLIDNLRSIVAHDRGFAPVYIAEKEQLLALLTKADNSLRALAAQQTALARAATRLSD